MTAGSWHPVKFAVFGIWILLWILGQGRAAAQVDPDASPPPPKPHGEYVWTGWNGESFELLNPFTLKARVMKELASIQVSIDSERDYEGALQRLNEAWVLASWMVEYDGRWEALRAVAEKRARVLMALGRNVEAENALDNLLLNLELSGEAFDVHRHSLATSDLLAEEQRELKNAVLVAMRAELGGRLGRGASAESPIHREVVEAIRRGDESLIETLGHSAVPILVELAEASIGSFIPKHDNDPLWYLVGLAEGRAAELIAANLEGDYLWRRRVLRIMDWQGVLGNSGTWDRSVSPAVCLVPQWLAALESFAADPELARESLNAISNVWKYAPLAPVLHRAVIDALQSADPDVAGPAFLMLEAGHNRDNERELLGELLVDERPKLRRYAAARLGSDRKEFNALLDQARHRDPEVRRSLALWLRDWQERNVPEDGPSEAELEAMAVLAGDVDPVVRDQAARSIISTLDHEPAPIELFNVLAEDSDPEVRKMAGRVYMHSDKAGADALLQRLAHDPDPGVRESVDRRIRQLHEQPARALALWRARWNDTQNPFWLGANVGVVRDAATAVIGFDEGLQQLARWYVATRDSERFPDLVQNASTGWSMRNALLDRFQSGLRNREGLRKLSILKGLGEEALSAFMLALDAVPRGGNNRIAENLLESLAKIMESDPPAVLGALRLVSADPDASPYLKTMALRLRAQAEDEGLEPSLIELLRDPRWARTSIAGNTFHELNALARALPKESRASMLVGAVRDPRTADAPTSQLTWDYDALAPDGEELTFAILERWYGARTSPMTRAVSRALLSSAQFPERCDRELLIDAVRMPAYVRDAIPAMASLLDPRFLPVLGDCVEARWVAPGTVQDEVRAAAVEAITRYFSDGASETLLEVVRRPISEAVRSMCFEALEKIRRYQDERALLSSRRVAQHARDGAIEKLAAKLSDPDPDVRALSASSLATLGAIELLPELIDLLGDPDEGVRTAAREAIEKLNKRADDGSK